MMSEAKPFTFGFEADLSSISNDPVLPLSDDFHQATIQVNEKGFEATAATSKLFKFY